jgi:hypothetical protein
MGTLFAMRLLLATCVVSKGVARRYWEAYAKVIPECFDFQGRVTSSHQNNATDPVNASLNYAYGFLEGEGECPKAINTVGLESAVGFLHEFSDYQAKQSLVYDLQEPFRWLADLFVMLTDAPAIDDSSDAPSSQFQPVSLLTHLPAQSGAFGRLIWFAMSLVFTIEHTKLV